MIIILVSVKFEILTAEHVRVRQLVSKVLEVSLFDIALLLVQYFVIGLLRKHSFLPISLVTLIYSVRDFWDLSETTRTTFITWTLTTSTSVGPATTLWSE